MIAPDSLRGANVRPERVEQDTPVVAPMRVEPAFPTDARALFGSNNPYAAAVLANGANGEEAWAGRVFASGGKVGPYAVRGGYTLQGEVAIPRPKAQAAAAVGGVTLGILLSFFLLFVLLRRQCRVYYHRYINPRFFSTSSVRAAAMGVPLSTGFRVIGDLAWAMLAGFLLWRGLWLQWYLRASDAETLVGLGVCMGCFLLLMGVRYAVLSVAEYLTGLMDLRWNIWENVQMPMRAFWPFLLVGAVLTVYIVEMFQWYALLVSAVVVCVGWLLRVYRTVMAFRWQGFGWLYFFLYLCGVEIMLPLLAMRVAMVYL